MIAIQKRNDRLLSLFAWTLAFVPGFTSAQSGSVATDLPTAKAYAKFSWPRLGSLSGDDPGTLVFADTRGDPSALRSYARRGNVGWAYFPGENAPHIKIVVALPGKDPYETDAVLLGYDRGKNAYVQVPGDALHKERLTCKVAAAGSVEIIRQTPAGLWRPESDSPSPFSSEDLGKKKSPTAGMILGDDRADKSQKQGLSQGKVSWTYNDPTDQPDDIRVVLIEANGNVRSPHADLRGFDSDKNAYVQVRSSIDEFNGGFYRIDNSGMPTRIDALPKNLWQPSSAQQEAQATPPPAAVAPRAPVVPLPNGKYTVTFTDPSTNQQSSAEMEKLAGSGNSDTPFDGVYHNQTYMVMIRGGELRVVPNHVPIGFQTSESPKR